MRGTGAGTMAGMRRRFAIFFLLFSLAVSLGADLLAQRRQRVRLPEGVPAYFRAFKSHELEGEIARVVLFNGLTILVEEHPNVPLVSIVTAVRLADASSPDEQGAAATVAHLMEADFQKELFAVGGAGEALTGRGRTVFSSVIPAENVLKGLDLHAALLKKPEFLPEAVAFSVASVSERRRAEQGTSRAKALLELNRLMGLADPNADWSVSKELAEASFLRHYRPENVVLSVSGSVRREQVLRKMVDLFPPNPQALRTEAEEASSESTASSGAGSSGSGSGYRNVRGNYRAPFLLVGFPWVSPEHDDFAALELVRYLAAVGWGSLLRLPIEEEPEAAPFDFEASVENLGERPVLVFDAVLKPGSFEKAEARLFSLLAVLAQQDLPTALLNRGKALMMTDFYRTQERLDGRAATLAHADLLGDYRLRDGFAERVTKVSSGDVRRVAKGYLSFSQAAVVEFQPEEEEPRTFTSETFAAAMEILIPARERTQIGLIDLFASDEPVAAFAPPSFKADYSETQLKRSSILRGPEIYLREQHSVPVVHAGFYFPGGRIDETPATSGSTELLAHSLLANLSRLNSGLRISSLEALGGHFSASANPDFFGFETVLMSPEIASATLDLVEFLRQVKLEERDVELAKLKMMRHFVLSDEAPVEAARRKARVLLYGSHPYGLDWKDDPGALARLDFKTVEGEHGRLLASVHPYIVVFGDIQGTSFLEGATTVLSNSKMRVGETVRKKVEVNLQEYKAGPIQQIHADGVSLVVFPGPQVGANYVEMLDVGQRLLSAAGSPLVDKFRSVDRLADRFQLTLEPLLGGGAIFVGVEGPEEGRKQAVEKMVESLKKFSGEAVSASQFYETVVGVITEHFIRQETPDAFLGDTMTAVLAGEKAEYAANYLMNLKVMRPGEVETALERFLGRIE